MPEEKKQPVKTDKTVEVLGSFGKTMQQVMKAMNESGVGPGGGSGVVSQARVGGAPPQLVGQPQVRGSVGIPQFQARPAPQGYPNPGGYETGFEFRSEGGRNAAVTAGAISNILQAVARHKQGKADTERTKAENMMELWRDAHQRGDTKMINALGSDPKFMGTLEKYLMFQLPRVQPNLIEDKATGAKEPDMSQSGMKSLLTAGGPSPKPDEAGGIMLPTPSSDQQLRAMINDATMRRLPEMSTEQIASLQLGPQAMLSGEQGRKAAQVQSGLELPADVAAQLSTQERTAYMQASASLSAAMLNAQADLKRMEMGEAGALERAKIGVGPEYERVSAMKKIAEENNKVRTEIANGKGANALRVSMASLRSVAAQHLRNAESARKDSREDDAKKYMDEANKLLQEATALEKLLNLDLDTELENYLNP